MLSNFFLKLDYFTRIVRMAKFHAQFHGTKKSRYPVWETPLHIKFRGAQEFATKNRAGIPSMGNSLPAQQTIPHTRYISKRDLCFYPDEYILLVQNTSTIFVQKIFCKKSYSLPIVTRQREVVN